MPQRVPPATYVCYRCGQKGKKKKMIHKKIRC